MRLKNIIFLTITISCVLYLAKLKNNNINCFSIGIENIDFFDQERNRRVIISILYPIDKGSGCDPATKSEVWKEEDKYINCPISTKSEKYPLIVFSHGYGGDKLGNIWLAEYLAKHGFIVAVMDHHGNTWYNLDEEISARTWEKALDLSFVITNLTESRKFGQFIDINKIGAAGFSQGGWSCLLLAGAKLDFSKLNNKIIDDKIKLHTFKDPRVKSIFVMAPGTLQGQLFTINSLKEIDVPSYIVTGESDDIIIPADNAYFFAANIPRAELHVLDSPANHWVFMPEATSLGKEILTKAATDYLINNPYGLSREEIHAQVSYLACKFFKSKFLLIK
jgi:predicted dienelactone hydrolase